MAAFWSALLILAFILSAVKSQGGNVTDECLILASNNEGGMNVTTTLRSGFTESHHFPNITQLPCGGSSQCPAITVDQANEVNINESVAIVMIERGLLLLRVMYEATSTTGPRLELTDSYALPLECTPLALIPSDEMGSYIIICSQGLKIEVRQLVLNHTADLSQSKETLLLRSSNDILPSNLNRTLLSNFLHIATNEDQIFFAYEEVIYRIRRSRFEITSFGVLPETPKCEFATRIVLDTSRGENLIIAYCPNIVVLFGISEMTWRQLFLRSDPRQILCSGDLLPENYTILNTERDTSIEMYGKDELCLQKNSYSFFIYRENSLPSRTLLVNLRMKTLIQLTEEDCSVDENILTIDDHYIIVADRSVNGLCNVKLFDVCGNYSAPLVTQLGIYSSIGVISGFIRNLVPPTFQPTLTPTSAETTHVVSSVQTVQTAEPINNSPELFGLLTLSLVPIGITCICVILIVCHRKKSRYARKQQAVALTSLHPHQSQTPEGESHINDEEQSAPTIEPRGRSQVPTPLSSSLSSPALTNPPMSAQELVLGTPRSEYQEKKNSADKFTNSAASNELAALANESSQEHDVRVDPEILQNPPGGIEVAYGYENINVGRPEEEQGAQGDMGTDVVTGRQPAHPSYIFSDHSVADNANRHQAEDTINRTNARVQQLDNR